jgi:hypothetical protein
MNQKDKLNCAKCTLLFDDDINFEPFRDDFCEGCDSVFCSIKCADLAWFRDNEDRLRQNCSICRK